MNALSRLTTVLFVSLLLVATGCDSLNNEEPEIASISEADLEAASSIMAESLSDQSEGLMADLNDMTARVSVQGLDYEHRRFHGNPMQRPCRGLNRDYEKTYDETTGVHSINYSRSHEGTNCEKTVSVSLNYIFTDSIGNFIATPFLNSEDIAEISFEGSRSGSGTYRSGRGGSSTRSFEQTGSWNLSGLQTDVTSLTGTQVSDGEFSRTRADSSGNQQSRSGTYHIELNTIDVVITQSAGEEDLENQITGTLQYTISMTRTYNGQTESRELEGTVELQGNGRALLRFNGLRQLYRVYLSNGEVEVTDSNG